MIVYPNLAVGSKMDLDFGYWDGKSISEKPAVLHACKFPCYREKAGHVNGPAFGTPDDRYYFVESERDLYLNMVDTPDPKYFSHILFTKSFDFINKHIGSPGGVFIHCNQGQSRSPGLALMYLRLYTEFFNEGVTFSEALRIFKDIYPYINMGDGMLYKVRECFDNPDIYLSTQLNSEVDIVRTK